MYSFLIIIVAIVLIALFLFARKKIFKQKNSIDLYSQTFGNLHNSLTRNVLDKCNTEIRNNRNIAENAFIRAEVTRFNLNDPERAFELYQLAINDAIVNGTETIEPETILDRLEDYQFQQDLLPNEIDQIRNMIAENRDEDFNRAIRSDPQNVHDSNVTNEIVDRYRYIRDLQPEFTGLYESINDPIAQEVIKDIVAKPSIISSLNITDAEVLGSVWARINHPENSDRRQYLVNSLKDSLKNCHNDSGFTVCVTGRVTNILDSLTLLDSNSEISKPIVTTEILRHDVLQTASNVVKNLPINLKTAYDNGDVDEIFINNLKETVKQTIQQEYAQHSGAQLDKIIEEAQLAIE